MAYRSFFALIPMLFLALAIVVALFGTETTERQLVDRLDGLVGVEAEPQIEESVAALWENSNTSGFAIVTLAVVLYLASILFVAWRDTLEDVINASADHRGRPLHSVDSGAGEAGDSAEPDDPGETGDR